MLPWLLYVVSATYVQSTYNTLARMGVYSNVYFNTKVTITYTAVFAVIIGLLYKNLTETIPTHYNKRFSCE